MVILFLLASFQALSDFLSDIVTQFLASCSVVEHRNTADSGLISIGETGASTVTNDMYFGLPNSLDDSDESDDAQDDERHSTIFDNDDDLGTAKPRRTSMEEDMVYRDLPISRPTNPPSYDTGIK
jgi:hypothetical protein